MMDFTKVDATLKYNRYLPQYLEYCNNLYANKAIWDSANTFTSLFLDSVVRGTFEYYTVKPLSYSAWLKAKKPKVERKRLYYVEGRVQALTANEFYVKNWVYYMKEYGIAWIDSGVQQGMLKPSDVVEVLTSNITSINRHQQPIAVDINMPRLSEEDLEDLYMSSVDRMKEPLVNIQRNAEQPMVPKDCFKPGCKEECGSYVTSVDPYHSDAESLGTMHAVKRNMYTGKLECVKNNQQSHS